MKKIIFFSSFLISGLLLSQFLPDLFGSSYFGIRKLVGYALSIALSFIMINVGREFELNKKEWRSYSMDYYVAMVTAALPWLLIAFYYMTLMPEGLMWDWGAWKENLLLSRFAAPTSAGILFAMLAAVGLKSSWVYKKIQTLAIFDDLDTILLMIPLQIMMVGLSWELHIILFVVIGLLVLGWKKLNAYRLPQRWYHILIYAVLVVGLSEFVYFSSKMVFVKGIHIEVLLPAFVIGMIIKDKPVFKRSDRDASTAVSYLFMLLVGLSMPLFIGEGGQISSNGNGVFPSMSWGEISFHVLIVSLLSNLGKLYPLAHYRNRSIYERLAISVGMFTRGEVGAGIIFIAIGYNIGGPLLAISVLTLVLNLTLTGVFIAITKQLALKATKLTPGNFQ